MGNPSETEKLEGRMFRVVVVEVTYVYKTLWNLPSASPPNAVTYFGLLPGIGVGEGGGEGQTTVQKDGAAGYNII